MWSSSRPTDTDSSISISPTAGTSSYELAVDASDDTADVRYRMIYHGPRAISDNRFAAWILPDEGVRQPPVGTSGRFSDVRITNEDPAVLDGADVTSANVPDLVRHMTANLRQYYANVHTEAFPTEAIRGQLRPADLSSLSKEELVETVLATAGPEALEGSGRPLVNTVIVVCYRDERVSYSLAVDGDVQSNPERGMFDGNDAVFAGRAEGAVTTGVDNYVFSGTVTDFSIDGEAAVYVNGTQVDLDLLGSGEDASLPNVMYVDGSGATGTGDACDYEFSVSRGVAKAPALGSAEAEDTIEEGTVSGNVASDVDAYRFSGVIRRLCMDGSARIRFGAEN